MKYRIKEIKDKTGNSVFFPQVKVLYWGNLASPAKYKTIGEARAVIDNDKRKSGVYKDCEVIIHDIK